VLGVAWEEGGEKMRQAGRGDGWSLVWSLDCVKKIVLIVDYGIVLLLMRPLAKFGTQHHRRKLLCTIRQDTSTCLW
jgi:hypothetical protein